MQTVIILQKTRIFRGDWANIRRASNSRLVLLQSPAAASQSPTYWRHFDETAVIADFDADGIERYIRASHVTDTPWIIITNDEYCLPLCAELRKRFGLPGSTPEQIALFTDKIAMKRQAAAYGLSIPRFIEFDAAEFKAKSNLYTEFVISELGLPLIAKPICDSNSKGVFKLCDPKELRDWCESNSSKAGLELEEFVSGRVFCCHTLVRDGELRLLMISEYINPPLDFDLGVPHGSIVIPPNSVEYEAVRLFNTQLLSALRPPRDCVTHLEVFLRPSGEVVLLEIAARPPGAYVSSAGEIFTGMNFEELNLLVQIGAKIKISKKPGPFSAWALFPKRKGTVVAFERPPLRSPHRIHWNVALGDQLDDIPLGEAHGTKHSSATLLLWNVNYEALRADFEIMRTHHPVQLS